MRKLLVWGIVLLGVLLSGCALPGEIVEPSQLARNLDPFSLSSGLELGQSFTAREQGLSGVEIFLRPESARDGVLSLKIFPTPERISPLAESKLILGDITEPGFYRFTFPPLSEAAPTDYYFTLELDSADEILVGRARGDRYLDGALAIDGVFQDEQLAFRLVYENSILGNIKTDGKWAAGQIYILGIVLAAVVLPGWLLLVGFFPNFGDLAWGEKLGLAVGLGIAFNALLFLWAKTFGINFSERLIFTPLAVSFVLYFAGVAAKRTPNGSSIAKNKVSFSKQFRTWKNSRHVFPDVALLLILGILFWSRWAAAREIEVPLWGDSVQHAVMAQRITEEQGLFDTWEPYAQYNSLTVHFGFAAAAAYLVEFVGSPKAVVEIGQILNVFAVLALYPLALKIANGSHWAGIGAVVVAGLLSPMPGFYTNWGRYAQLAGQVVMPVALWLLWVVVEEEKFNWRKISLAGIALAGMLLNYYRTPFYYGPFAIALLIGWGLPQWGWGRDSFAVWRNKILMMAAVGAIGFVLFLPWASNLLGGTLASFVGNDVIVTDDTVLSLVLDDYRAWLQIGRYLPWGLIAAAVIAVGVALYRKNWTVSIVSLWVVGLSSIVATRLIGLPGANFMQNFSIIIMLYMPASWVVGWLFGIIVERIDRLGELRLVQSFVFIVVIAVSIFVAHSQSDIVNARRHALVTRPDLRAMAWIAENTPDKAVFLVQGFGIWQGFSVVGSDAGWWIPLLAGRRNTMPPQYALLNEAPVALEYTRQVIDLIAEFDTPDVLLQDNIATLCAFGVTHIYQGQRQGEIGGAAVPLFSNAELAAFPEVYHADRVRIHEVQCEDSNGG